MGLWPLKGFEAASKYAPLKPLEQRVARVVALG